MKALILAAGRGKRMQLCEEKNKCMLELGGKPILEYNLERAWELDVDEIILVVGHRAEEIINRYGNNFRGKKISYVIQWEQRGLVHAIECAAPALKGEDFFLLLGDEVLVNSRHKEMFSEFLKSKDIFGLCGVCIAEDRSKISRTYTVVTDQEGRIFRLIEKPKKALSDYQGTGHCVFRNEILNYIERTPIHYERKEKELPDLVQCVVDDGHIVKIFNICDKYTNVNTEQDLIEAKKLMGIA
jgi:dTDP-glucose pyrophosphorylase